MTDGKDDKEGLLGLPQPLPRKDIRNGIGRWKKLAVISTLAAAFVYFGGRPIRHLCEHSGNRDVDSLWAVHRAQSMPPEAEANEQLFLYV
jgi:hypothetical protein